MSPMEMHSSHLLPAHGSVLLGTQGWTVGSTRSGSPQRSSHVCCLLKGAGVGTYLFPQGPGIATPLKGSHSSSSSSYGKQEMVCCLLNNLSMDSVCVLACSRDLFLGCYGETSTSLRDSDSFREMYFFFFYNASCEKRRHKLRGGETLQNIPPSATLYHTWPDLS